jgi:S-adenosylmethionine-diacylglycerol 3-amino-3-carboxypropyl transferase
MLNGPPNIIHYGQCWEDADILLEALQLRPGDTCLSIASGGDNTLALLTRDPTRIIAVDANPAQLACLELRMAAYRSLSHGELLELYGSAPSARRPSLYRRCRAALPPVARQFWDQRPHAIDAGIGNAGRFERFLAFFRRWVLPVAQRPASVPKLLQGGGETERTRFHDGHWNHWRWRLLFRLFFSRWALGRYARYPGCFRHAEGDLAAQVLTRARHAMTILDPAANPYLQWMCAGRHLTALPCALRPENFAAIRDRLDRITLICAPLGQAAAHSGEGSIDRYNLSDVFEYLAPGDYRRQLAPLIAAARPGARLVYWNLLAPRSRPEDLADRLRPMSELAQALHARDRVFFYRALVIEERA